MDGLIWNKDFKLEPVAFGMKKLRLGCVVEDEKVFSFEDISDQITAWEDEVQSVDIFQMQKVWIYTY